MYKPYPPTPTFTGFNAPRRIEAEVFDLEVEGELPRTLAGTIYRCGPDPRFAPKADDDININGDGMVTMFRFRDGNVDFKSRYVRTEKYQLETAARRALFGAYRNPYTDDPSVAGKDRTTANTNIVFHAGRLFALKEDGLPHELDPHSLETKGRTNYGGKLRSLTHTAHPKIDPRTGEMISFGYEAAGLASRDMSLQVIDAAGNLVREEWFEAPYCSFQHDFAVSRDHIVFLLMPTIADDRRMRAGGPHWVFEPSRDVYIGIMRRDASVKDIRWYRAPALGIGHVLNACSDRDKVCVDLFISERNQFPFVPNADGTAFDREKGTPRLTRWTFDLRSAGDSFETRTLYPEFMEMPAIDARYAMESYRYGYCAVIDRTKPLNVAGTIGLAWNTIARIDHQTGMMQRFYVGERTTAQEPIFVPRRADSPEGDGHLLVVVTRFEEGRRTELVVLDAMHLQDGPVSTVRLPFCIRGAIHGNWVPEEALGSRAAV
jgi:carotenoid cleavage dioxygenase-like enzyme